MEVKFLNLNNNNSLKTEFGCYFLSFFNFGTSNKKSKRHINKRFNYKKKIFGARTQRQFFYKSGLNKFKALKNLFV